MEKIQLTAEEERLLIKIYSNKEMVQKGELLSHQKECLNEIRASKKYLQQKYEKDFEIICYFPITRNKLVGEMVFCTNGKYYKLSITKKEDYVILDNYYQSLIQNKYDKALTDLLEVSLRKNVKVFTQFSSLMGIEFNGKVSIEKIFNQGSKLDRTTSIFLNEEDINLSQIGSQLKKIMLENNLYGSYVVYIGPKLLGNISSGQAMKKEAFSVHALKKVVFNCFEVI